MGLAGGGDEKEEGDVPFGGPFSFEQFEGPPDPFGLLSDPPIEPFFFEFELFAIFPLFVVVFASLFTLLFIFYLTYRGTHVVNFIRGLLT